MTLNVYDNLDWKELVHLAEDNARLQEKKEREWQEYRKQINTYLCMPRPDIRVRKIQTPLEASLFPRLTTPAKMALTCFYDFADYIASIQQNLEGNGYGNNVIDYVRYTTGREFSRFHYAKYLGDASAYLPEYVENSERFRARLEVLRYNMNAPVSEATLLSEYVHHPKDSAEEGALRLKSYIKEILQTYDSACHSLGGVEVTLKPLSGTKN